MKNILKIFLSFVTVVLSLCVFFDILSVKALSNIDHVSKLFEEFITKCFNDEENVLVYDGEQRRKNF
ncbi:MAG: hypothetical protein ACLTBQ_02210 [Thomasclavelia sp.]|uniref:hypothetical protein n=1 Tax=Thomasclavelia sp. TaxID=3025757 RepID=UPI003995AFAD